MASPHLANDPGSALPPLAIVQWRKAATVWRSPLFVDPIPSTDGFALYVDKHVSEFADAGDATLCSRMLPVAVAVSRTQIQAMLQFREVQAIAASASVLAEMTRHLIPILREFDIETQPAEELLHCFRISDNVPSTEQVKLVDSIAIGCERAETRMRFRRQRALMEPSSAALDPSFLYCCALATLDVTRTLFEVQDRMPRHPLLRAMMDRHPASLGLQSRLDAALERYDAAQTSIEPIDASSIWEFKIAADIHEFPVAQLEGAIRRLAEDLLTEMVDFSAGALEAAYAPHRLTMAGILATSGRSYGKWTGPDSTSVVLDLARRAVHVAHDTNASFGAQDIPWEHIRRDIALEYGELRRRSPASTPDPTSVSTPEIETVIDRASQQLAATSGTHPLQLHGWAQILEALSLDPKDTSARKRIGRLSKLHNGPIRRPENSKSVVADAADLCKWHVGLGRPETGTTPTGGQGTDADAEFGHPCDQKRLGMQERKRRN